MRPSTAVRACALAALVLLTDPPAIAQAPPAAVEETWRLEPTDSPAGERFTIAARATERELCVDLHLQPGWHMYARDTGGGVPVGCEVLPGSSFAAAGDLVASGDERGQIVGHATLTLPLKRTAPGRALRVRFSYMVCDELMCLPPRTLELATVGREPLRVLVVTTEDAARNARIEAFLTARGLRCTLARYGDVTAAACDAHDVVVADSPNGDEATWQATARLSRKAEAFPSTRSPIVAVGFLGTRLLEGQKVAMASGYI